MRELTRPPFLEALQSGKQLRKEFSQMGVEVQRVELLNIMTTELNDWEKVVKVEDSNRSRGLRIKDKLEFHCGTIRNIRLYTTGKKDGVDDAVSHLFVEFDDPASAARARLLKLDGVQIHRLDPQLSAKYRQVARKRLLKFRGSSSSTSALTPTTQPRLSSVSKQPSRLPFADTPSSLPPSSASSMLSSQHASAFSDMSQIPTPALERSISNMPTPFISSIRLPLPARIPTSVAVPPHLMKTQALDSGPIAVTPAMMMVNSSKSSNQVVCRPVAPKNMTQSSETSSVSFKLEGDSKMQILGKLFGDEVNYAHGENEMEKIKTAAKEQCLSKHQYLPSLAWLMRNTSHVEQQKILAKQSFCTTDSLTSASLSPNIQIQTEIEAKHPEARLPPNPVSFSMQTAPLPLCAALLRSVPVPVSTRTCMTTLSHSKCTGLSMPTSQQTSTLLSLSSKPISAPEKIAIAIPNTTTSIPSPLPPFAATSMTVSRRSVATQTLASGPNTVTAAKMRAKSTESSNQIVRHPVVHGTGDSGETASMHLRPEGKLKMEISAKVKYEQTEDDVRTKRKVAATENHPFERLHLPSLAWLTHIMSLVEPQKALTVQGFDTTQRNLPVTPSWVTRVLSLPDSHIKTEGMVSDVIESSTSSPASQTNLALTISGVVVPYNLNTLDPDPQNIINLLKLSSSERDKWMVTACCYRRNGMSEAAIEIVQTMVEVMMEHGTKEEDLKPAFLMLSACATDVARTLKNGNTKSSEEYAHKARVWFLKAFGETTSSRVLEPEVAKVLDLEPIPFAPKGAGTSAAEPSSPVDPASLNPPLPDLLHAELVRLRAEKIQLDNRLSVAHASKRRREEDLQAERIVIRRLEHQRDLNADVKRQARSARPRSESDSTARPIPRDRYSTRTAGKNSLGRGGPPVWFFLG
ncbi:hypothetical protein HWV62_40987 [Athelia sp. TMB]|nr:hypothetical protein HWV62_40987 [Athelia sp. TMB]